MVEDYIPGHEGDHPEAEEDAGPGSQQDEPEPQEYVDLRRKKGSQTYVTKNPVRYGKYKNIFRKLLFLVGNYRTLLWIRNRIRMFCASRIQIRIQ